ncbi:M23 family metallopeptidase [Streptomyces sp. G3]|jgi:murein DD-endopeptidase MepM/ murein hydrolase activator NlpD|uniref:M23 family metallopeptidase n=1 Tax=Streptomyces salinarius TaxID=2762598 RepID=A0ABW8BNE3_9ACTN|nr:MULTISPECIES: M23 family metallopeptidase [Streptomyces]WSU02223.1 M23 family metallopeptidase [Streptomyces sp. NBC_01124]AZM76375.1 M23 family metallopeptidase [Streptomyces sp. KPB2]MBH5133176.1 M23 family metallopeptidase [Streptomyces sp. HB-N217]MCM1939833.1 M23 family metallopeptidase [Streptomyces sp. G3]MCQ4202808.1 M23 family metallopeptidase [Streptomyces coelicoflavus]
MFPRVTSRSSRTTIRTRAAVMAAGLGASVALGAGVAAATGTTAATSTNAAASAVEAQAAAQAKAAKAEKAAASAKKTTTAKKTATKKKAASWVDPVKKYTLSASFAQNGGMWAHKHSGQDFAVPIGTNVVATHGGTVVKAGGNGAGDGPAYGNAIVIKHGNGTYSQYAHLSKINVKIGQVVKTGQSIAKSGNTGNSSGPHLHFEIRTTPNYGSAVDPVAFLKAKGVTV